jgi:hypothetical protein
MRRAARRDENEAAIVEALRKAGAYVQPISGKDVPDLLVGFAGKTFLFEVKRPAGKKGGTSHRNLLPGQERFHQQWRGGLVSVVRSPVDALKAIGCGVESEASGTVCPDKAVSK